MHDKNEINNYGNFENNQHRINKTNRQFSTFQNQKWSLETENTFWRRLVSGLELENLPTKTKLENRDLISVDVWKLWYAVFYFILLLDL